MSLGSGSGTVHPAFNIAPTADTLNYQYDASSIPLLAEMMLATHENFKQFQPFFLAGLGVAWNRLSNYQESPTDPSGTAVPMVVPYANATQASFAYELGLGLKRQTASGAAFSVAYRFMDLGAAKVDVVDASDFVKNNTLSLTNSIPVGGQPSGIALSPDQKTLYVSSNEKGGRVYVIDVATEVVTKQIALTDPVSVMNLANPAGIAVSPDGSKVYVAGFDSSNVAPKLVIINSATNSLADLVALKANVSIIKSVAVSPDSAKVVIAGSSTSFDGVAIVGAHAPTTDQSVVSTSPASGFTFGAAFTPDGKFVYVANFSPTPTGSISVINMATQKVIKTISSVQFNFPSGIQVTPDGKKIFVAQDDLLELRRSLWCLKS